MSFADEGPGRRDLPVKISLEKARTIPSFETEMLQQLTTDFLSEEKSGFYYARVRYRNNTYVVYGTLKEWHLFFCLSRWNVANPGFGVHPDFTN